MICQENRQGRGWLQIGELAATVWLAPTVGKACGAGLPILAIFVTIGNFSLVLPFPLLERRVPRSGWTPSLRQAARSASETQKS